MDGHPDALEILRASNSRAGKPQSRASVQGLPAPLRQSASIHSTSKHNGDLGQLKNMKSSLRAVFKKA